MKRQFSYKTNLFVPIFIFSLTAHVVLISSGKFIASPVVYSVIEAPNSIEILIVEESIILQPKEIINEEVIAVDPVEAIQPEMQKQEIVKEEIVEKAIEPDISSVESQGAISGAKPINHVNPAPLYPRVAKRRGWEGKVILKVFVKKDGTPGNIEVRDSSGYKILDDAAVDTVVDWQFEPAQSKFGNISTWITIPIHFKLVNR